MAGCSALFPVLGLPPIPYWCLRRSGGVDPDSNPLQASYSYGGTKVHSPHTSLGTIKFGSTCPGRGTLQRHAGVEDDAALEQQQNSGCQWAAPGLPGTDHAAGHHQRIGTSGMDCTSTHSKFACPRRLCRVACCMIACAQCLCHFNLTGADNLVWDVPMGMCAGFGKACRASWHAGDV